MKYIYVTIVILSMSFSTFSQDKTAHNTPEVTTYYLIRHAEKDQSNPSEKNPHLTDEGLNRAENWSKILESVGFDAVYSTDYHRTKETAQPSANKNNLDILIYDPTTLDIDKFKNETNAKTVLIVGHSNTIPSLVNSIIGKKKYEDMNEAVYGNLFIVTVIGDHVTDQVLMID